MTQTFRSRRPRSPSPAEVVDIAERIKAAIADPCPLNGGEVAITVSVGIALASGSEDRAETLLRDADTAMYRAKDHGKDRHEVFTDVMRTWVANRVDAERDLRQAIHDERLRVLYQPIISLHTNTITAVEALVRYQDPGGRLVEPEQFLEVAEESGLIVPVGSWVVQQACQQAQQWRAAAPTRPPLAIAVNLSARQVARPDLALIVTAALSEAGLEPGLLSFEITETVLMDATKSTAASFGALRDLGVHLGVDDFGVGYSSLAYLKRFPVDFLKVDRSFVAGIGQSLEDSAIVTAIVGLGHSLGMTVIAEGVETTEQLDALRALGCDGAQGYYFARPQPSDAIDELVRHANLWP